MKIYILPVNKEFQPLTIPIVYPPHNKGFKDGEEVFLRFLENNPDLLTTIPDEADWYYLPIFWTHWLVAHKFGNIHLDRLQREVNRVMIDDSKTFTIYEYAEQPKVDVGKMKAFLGSRTSPEGFDIPLLCAPHSIPKAPPVKKYLASFVGNLSTHPIRDELKNELKHRKDILIAGGGGTDYFVQVMLESYIALCPRGYGGASYRFYEALQLGTMPLLIGDIDHRPFKKFLNWDMYSLYAKGVARLDDLLDDYRLNARSKNVSLVKGIAAKYFYKRELADGNWCKYVLEELTFERDNK